MPTPPDECTKEKSAVHKTWHSPYTWVLLSFVFGVLLMAAVGEGNDIEKAIWFATGAAVTAAATAYQTYQSNKRAADERAFSDKQKRDERRHQNHVELQRHTASIRVKEYQRFIACCTAVYENPIDMAARDRMLNASIRIGLVSPDNIFKLSRDIMECATKVYTALKDDKSTAEDRKNISGEFGKKLAQITTAMRIDLGRSSVELDKGSNTNSIL